MATHDYVLDNQTGQNFRSDLNNALAAIVSNNSSSSEPSTKYAYQWWADTNASVLKIRNSANDAWITLFTLAGGVDVDAASNFNEDVTFTGASANIVFDKSDNALEFADSVKAAFGTDTDCTLFHDGGNLHFANTTGTFKIKGDDIKLQKADGNEDYFTAAVNGAVTILFDSATKLATTTNGISVTGKIELTDNIDMPDSAKIILGTGSDLEIFFDGTHSKIDHTPATGSLFLGGDGLVLGNSGFSEYYLDAAQNGAVNIRFDATTKLATTTNGISVTGKIELTDNIDMPDSAQIILGTGDDLKIEADGSNSKIVHNGDGNLVIEAAGSDEDITIQATDDVFIKVQSNENAIRCLGDGAVECYFGNELVFSTTATGVNVFNTNGNGELRVRGSEGNGAQVYIEADDADDNADQWRLDVSASDGAFGIQNKASGSFEKNIECNGNDNVELYFDNSKKFNTSSTGIDLHGLSTGAGNSDLRYNSSTGQVTYDTSTILVKENIQEVPYGLNIVNQLQPKIYERTDDNNKIELGFIAEEMEKLIPEIVPKIKGLPVNVDYRKVCVVLTKAIQELSAKVAALEAA
jgi:hypothetical protein